MIILYQNSFCKLFVDVISAVLYRDDAVLFVAGDDGDGFTDIATEREEECVQLFVVGLEGGDDILFALCCLCKIHNYPPCANREFLYG